MEGVLVEGKGARTPSEQCGGTLEQSAEPTTAHIGPYDELVTHPGVDPSSPIVYPPRDPERDKVVRKMTNHYIAFK